MALLSTDENRVSTYPVDRPVKKQENRDAFRGDPPGLPAFEIFGDYFSKTGPYLEPASAAVIVQLSTFPRQTVTAAGEIHPFKSFS
jgi:hypothetical protein